MEELYTRIEDYLDDRLDATQRAAFEAEARADPALTEALARLRETRERLARQWAGEKADADLAATLSRLGEQHFAAAPAGRPTFRKFSTFGRLAAWAAAASVALLLAWVFWPSAREQRLYADYRRFPEAGFVTRSNDPAQTPLARATDAFNQGDYAEALALLQQRLQTPPDDPEVRLFAALCQLELGRTREAAAAFEQIRATPGAWAGEATWYLALTYLKEKNRAQCAATLREIDPGEAHYEEAQKLMMNYK